MFECVLISLIVLLEDTSIRRVKLLMDDVKKFFFFLLKKMVKLMGLW